MEYASNVIDTITLLDNLGFVPHPKKSVFIPTQILVFREFVLNSIHMTVSDKANMLKTVVTHLLSCTRVSRQFVRWHKLWALSYLVSLG